MRYIFTFLGYRLGTDFITKAEESGIMSLVTKYASILGLTVAGAMTAEMVYFEVPIKFGTGDAATTVQKIVDGIIPGLFPLLLTGVVYYMLKKGMKPLVIMLILMVASVIGVYFKVLA